MTLKPLGRPRCCQNGRSRRNDQVRNHSPRRAQEKPQVAEVVAVGPGGLVDGKEVTMTVHVGDKVITGTYAGTEVKCDGEEYNIVRQSDILAVVE